jgi:hypothetical protein
MTFQVAKPAGSAPLRAPLPPKALKVDHSSKENAAPNANGHANGHHSPGEESNVPLSRNASIGGYVHSGIAEHVSIVGLWGPD